MSETHLWDAVREVSGVQSATEKHRIEAVRGRRHGVASVDANPLASTAYVSTRRSRRSGICGDGATSAAITARGVGGTVALLDRVAQFCMKACSRMIGQQFGERVGQGGGAAGDDLAGVTVREHSLRAGLATRGDAVRDEDVHDLAAFCRPPG